MRTGEVPVDELDDLRGAVVGDGLLLIPGKDRPMRLYAVAGGRARWLGSCTDALAAWQFLDGLVVASPEDDHDEEEPPAVDGAA
jgi:hypothetical protein